MYSYDRTAATIDQSSLDKWKKDLRLMTKIYKSIDPEVGIRWDADETDLKKQKAMWDEARQLFLTFKNNFVEWVYKVVLPKKDKREGQGPLESAVAKSTWNFKHELEGSMLFPELQGRAPDWSKFRHERDRNLKRYQAAAVKAFKDLESLIEARGGKLERRDYIEHLEVGGVNVTLRNWGRDNYDDRLEEGLDTHLRNLRHRLDEIKRAGFPGAIKGMSLTIDFNQEEWDTNAYYRPSEDLLVMYPLGLVGDRGGHGTLVHEIGHRFYFKELPSQARTHWEEVMNQRGVKITEDDVHRFTQAIIKKYDPSRPTALYDDADRYKAALPLAESAEDLAKFRELAKSPIVSFGEGGSFDPRWYEKFTLDNKKDEVVQIEEITDYGNTHPAEAFAEVFRLWVTKGPGAVGPWTRNFFKEISRAGGAKLASEAYVSVFR